MQFYYVNTMDCIIIEIFESFKDKSAFLSKELLLSRVWGSHGWAVVSSLLHVRQSQRHPASKRTCLWNPEQFFVPTFWACLLLRLRGDYFTLFYATYVCILLHVLVICAIIWHLMRQLKRKTYLKRSLFSSHKKYINVY